MGIFPIQIGSSLHISKKGPNRAINRINNNNNILMPTSNYQTIEFNNKLRKRLITIFKFLILYFSALFVMRTIIIAIKISLDALDNNVLTLLFNIIYNQPPLSLERLKYRGLYKKKSQSVPTLISQLGLALIPFSLPSLLLLLLLYYYHTTAILLPFYIICLLTILLHVPKCLFLSRIALKMRILPHKLAFRMPKLNGIILLPGGEDGTLLRRALSQIAIQKGKKVAEGLKSLQKLYKRRSVIQLELIDMGLRRLISKLVESSTFQ